MHQTPSRGQGRYGPKTPSKTPLMKGLFADGIWKCNCDPRLPADRFQTKNGGPNHGRWFYTCQKPAPKRCGFFLWDSEAKPREAQAVLSNSRTEPGVTTTGSESPGKMSPNKTVPYMSPMHSLSPVTSHPQSKPAPLPDTGLPARIGQVQNPTKYMDDWLYVSEDEEWSPPDTPSKSIKRNETSSPSKRNREETTGRSNGRPVYPKPTANIELFNTPNHPTRGRGLFSDDRQTTHPQTTSTGGLVTPITNRTHHSIMLPNDDSIEKIPVLRDESPTARKSKNIQPHQSPNGNISAPSPSHKKPIELTPLADQILNALREEGVDLTHNMANSVKAISLSHVNEFRKVQKGRDWCRERIKNLDSKILELQGEIGKLKGETPIGRK